MEKKQIEDFIKGKVCKKIIRKEVAEIFNKKSIKSLAKRFFKFMPYILGVVVLLFSFYFVKSYNKSIHNTLQKHFIKSEKNLKKALKESIKIKYKKKEVNVFFSGDLKELKDSNKNYQDFVMKYYEIQNNFLNTWMTTLAILLAILTIIIPFIVYKFTESKEKLINREINDLNQRKKEVRELMEVFKKEGANKLKDLQKHFDLFEIKTKELEDKSKILKNEIKEDIKKEQEISNLFNNVFNLNRNKKNTEAINLLNIILKKDTFNLNAFLLKAQIILFEISIKNYNNRKLYYANLNEAKNIFLQILEKNKKLDQSRMLDQSRIIEIYCNLSWINILLDDYESSNKYLKKAKKINSKYVGVLQQELIVLLDGDNTTEAEKKLNELLLIEGKNVNYNYNLAELLLKQFKYKEALQNYKIHYEKEKGKWPWIMDYDKVITPMIKKYPEESDLIHIKNFFESIIKNDKII